MQRPKQKTVRRSRRDAPGTREIGRSDRQETELEDECNVCEKSQLVDTRVLHREETEENKKSLKIVIFDSQVLISSQ